MNQYFVSLLQITRLFSSLYHKLTSDYPFRISIKTFNNKTQKQNPVKTELRIYSIMKLYK